MPIKQSQQEDWQEIKVVQNKGKSELIVENIELLNDHEQLILTRDGSRFKIGFKSTHQPLPKNDI